MKGKTLKYVAIAGVAYLAYKALSHPGGLKGLADDLTNDIPSEVDVPYVGYGYGYGYNPFQYQQYGMNPYYGGYPNQFQGYPFGNYPPPAPVSQPAYFNPFGGYSAGGVYIPKVVTASGGVQGY